MQQIVHILRRFDSLLVKSSLSFLLLWFLIHPIAANEHHIKSQSLLINQQSVFLNTELVYDKGTLFIPLRDVSQFLKTDLFFNKSRFQEEWTLSSKNTLYFSMHLPYYLVNDQTSIFWQKLPQKQFNRIYISYPDLKEILSIYLPHIRLQLSNAKPVSSPINPKSHALSPSKAVKKTPPVKQITALSENLSAAALPLDDLPLPSLSNGRRLSISAQGYTINASNHHRMYQGRLWFNFEHILSQLGYTIRKTKTGYVAKKGSRHFVFSTNSKTLRCAWIENQWLSPMKKTALYLGFIPFWQKQTVYLLNYIKDITISQKEGGSQIVLKATHPIKHSKLTKIDSKQSYIDLNYSYFDSKTHIKKLKHDNLNTLILGKHPTFHRLLIHSKAPISLNKTDTHLSLFMGQATDSSLSNTSTYAQALPPPKKRQVKRNIKAGPKTIAIDPGHGGYDPGAVIDQTILEKKYAWDISLKLKHHLEKKGYKVIMLRKWDKNPSLWQRVKKANQNNCDALISVHLNAFKQVQVHGSESYYYKYQDKAFAKQVHSHIIQALGTKNNGLKRSKMYVLNHAKMPSVLIEPAYMSNKQNFNLIKSAHFQHQLAIAITSGLDQYFLNQLAAR